MRGQGSKLVEATRKETVLIKEVWSQLFNRDLKRCQDYTASLTVGWTNECGDLVNCHWQWRTEVFVEKYVQVRQIWHGLDRDRTQGSTLTDWQPVTWAMAQPSGAYYVASTVWTESQWIFQLVNQLAYLWSGYIWFAFRDVSLTCKGLWFMQCCTLWWHAELLVHCHGGWWWFGIWPVRNIVTTVFSHIFVRTGTQTLDRVCWDKVFVKFTMCFYTVIWYWGGGGMYFIC